MLEAATQLHVPLQDEGKGVECVLAPPVSSMSRSSFQELLVRLPVRRGGLGLRSCVDTSPAAFVGSVEMSLLHSAREVYSRRSPDNPCQHPATHLDNLCIDHWLFVMIICLVTQISERDRVQ